MRIDRDVVVPARDGVPLVLDVFRPDGDRPAPVIAAMSPYGKDVHWPERYPLYDLVDQGEHMVWETPNPEWWTERGFAVVRADARGTGGSGGRFDVFGRADAEDFFDVVEWCGTRPWSTGKVATSGISWYAMMGWRVAALRPPHLAAIVAWEGCTDFYRDWGRQGGIYANATEGWWRRQIIPQLNGGGHADMPAELSSRELVDDWYRERTVDLSQVRVPVLSAGNWGSIHLHLRGNVEGWLGAASEHKWLVVHVGSHIDPYYADWAKELQLRFLRRFLRDDETAMDGVAPVRLAIRRGREVEWRDEQDWPLPRTRWSRLYLGAGELGWERPAAGSTPHPADFEFTATERLEITGPLALRLWVSSTAEDVDVLVRLEQYDANGARIPGIGPGGAETPVPMAVGWLRASHRELDPDRTLPHRPWHRHEEPSPLEAGVPALLEVELWPTSLTLEPGHRLRLGVRSEDDDLGDLAHDDPADRRRGGDSVLHFGGDHASHLFVPVIPE
ncbi:CocE/NonD family hydrolase [Saccharopolyspora sp. MS10]|uniref:CocE/NonD family hydrolase n=1 Tax=Saccharopolyspora sp. MS10 TaxID=3385973 RepID=UPI0039A3BF45